MATMTIWYGKPTPMHVIGINQSRMLSFFARNKTWHSVANDRATQRAKEALIKKGYLIENEWGQCRIHYP